MTKQIIKASLTERRKNAMGLSRITGFYKPEFKISLFKTADDVSHETVWVKSTEEYEYYFICYIYSGNLEYSCAGNTVTLCENQFVICKPFEPCNIFTIPNVDSRYCLINFSGQLFNSEESELLRAFNNRNNGEDNIYRIEEAANSVLFKQLADSFSEYTKKRLSKAHFTSLLKMFISEICIAFDQTHPNDIERYSDEYDLRIYDFICQNFNKNITIDTVSENFFVSRWYVNNLCHRFYKLPFKQMITDMRMWYARGLIVRNSKITLAKVAQLCGYKEYSAFFRAYNNYFGVSPKDDLEKYLATGSFNRLPKNRNK